MNKLYIFPGAHKTATTLLQKALEVKRRDLEQSGFAVARRKAFYETGMKKILRNRDGIANILDSEREDFLTKIFGCRPHNQDAVLSIENLFGEIFPHFYSRAGCAIENIKHLFPFHDIHVFLYIRRQDDFLESAYVQSVHNGNDVSVEQYVSKFERRILDWWSVLNPVFERLGRDRVNVVPYESIHDGADPYISSFFMRFTDGKVTPPRADELKDASTNISLSQIGVEMAQAAFPLLPDRPSRRSVARTLQRDFGADKYARFRMPDRLKLQIRERHVEANEALIEAGLLPDRFQSYYRFSTI